MDEHKQQSKIILKNEMYNTLIPSLSSRIEQCLRFMYGEVTHKNTPTTKSKLHFLMYDISNFHDFFFFFQVLES